MFLRVLFSAYVYICFVYASCVLYMCMRVYVVYVSLCICVYMCVYVCMCVCMCTCICVYMCVYVYVYVCVCA